ncbi:MAG TPA: zinc-dependent metalloprotease family protein, partial [Enhygromyxa sp.]|nr:zinc-dependent metalloprotease family protein [Enhygromyxa sp.]
MLCWLPACTSDDSQADTALSGDGDTSDSGDGDGDSNFEPVPARGITITKVTANHGVNVSLANGAEWVDGTGREARLVSGRDTIIRVYHQLDPNWVEREIEARLELTVGGETHEFTARKEIVTDTIDTYLDGALYFALPAENGFTATDAKFQVSLWEVEPGGEDLPEQVNVAPASGLELIGFESIPMEMNVFFVPFNWNGRVPSVDDAMKMEKITNEIYQTEPIQTLNSAVDEIRTGGSSNVCGMLQTMQQIWSIDGAPANIYYVGLVDTGASSGVMGCAWLNSNVNADVWVDSSIGITATSIVHEIGHNMGLAHVACNAGNNPAADPDPSYPDHPDGRTLNTGFGIRDYSMYPGETTTDYMSYCIDRWVSPWTWNKVWPRIQSFTEMGSPLIVDPEPVLQFGMYPDGTESWWTALARLDPTRTPDDARIEFVLDGEVIARERAQVDTLSDDASIWVTVRMPNGDPEAEFDSVRYV